MKNATFGQLPDLRGHTQTVISAFLSPDNEHIVTACEDKYVRIFSFKTYQLEKELKQHNDLVRYACYSPDGKIIASSGNDHLVNFWSVD